MVRPPMIKESWEDNDIWAQAQMIAYSQIREYEDMEMQEAMMNSASLGAIKKRM